jgi:hypothetical protein
MILGVSVGAFATFHVIISLVAIVSGLIVLVAMIANRRLDGLTALFLGSAVLTSATGFVFHSRAIGPPHVVGVISLVDLAIALLALYGRGLAGVWRPVYVTAVVIVLYLNCFVGVAQAFQKIPFLHGLAPNGSEPPFLVVQAATLAAFALLGYLAVRAYRPRRPADAASRSI